MLRHAVLSTLNDASRKSYSRVNRETGDGNKSAPYGHIIWHVQREASLILAQLFT